MRWMTYSSTLSCRPDRLLVPKSLSQKERFCSVTLALYLPVLLVSAEAILSEREALAASPRVPAQSARPLYSTFFGVKRLLFTNCRDRGLLGNWAAGSARSR